MHKNSTKKQQDEQFIPTFLMYTGAFLFSIILLVFVHELGHFLAFRWKGYEEVIIRITPFFGTTTSSQNIQMGDAEFIILGGTLFNLLVASLLAIILRRIKTPFLIPLKMYPIMAFLIEGMVILGGLFFDQTITDFAMLLEIGWSRILIGILGLTIIFVGGYLSYEMWILLGFTRESPRKKLFWINSQYALYFLAGYLISQMILPIELRSVRELLAICMVLHWLYLGIRILFAPVILAVFELNKVEQFPKISLHSGVFSIILGFSSWVASILVLNN